MAKQLKTVLSIAASDPMGGAGIQQDVRIGSSLNLHVVTAVTAITVQNSKGFDSCHPVSHNTLWHQLYAIVQDVTPDAIKIGMPGSIENIKLIAEFLKTFPHVSSVVDPILYPTVTSNQGEKEIEQLKDAYLNFLFPLASMITPNLEEFKYLSGEIFDSDTDLQNYLKKLNVKNLVVKGGHSKNDLICDYLITQSNISKFEHPRVECSNLHGTGCAFSTLLASFLALNFPIEQAFKASAKSLENIIGRSCGYNLGNSDYGPLNVFNYNFAT